MKLMIVDDEVAIREVVRDIVGDLFVEISEASNGAEALTLIQTKKFDVVISDYHMPKMSGLDLLKHFRERRICIPVIWLTGRGSADLKKEAWNYRAFDFLEKPFSIEELRESVEALIGLDPQRRERLFADPFTPISKVSYEQISKNLSKGTYRALQKHCEEKNLSLEEVATQLISGF